MKTLIVASAAVLALGIGSAFAATSNVQQDQQHVALNAQTNGAQTSSYNGQAPAQTNSLPPSAPYIGGYTPPPANSMWTGG